MDWLSQLDPTGEVTLMIAAVALGAFVGLRREIDLQKKGVPGFVGFRTMPLITLLGCIVTFFPLFPYMPVVGLGAIIGFLVIAYYNGVFQLQLLGLTSELSTLIMYLVGVLVGYGHLAHGVLITVFVAAFSAFKPEMHHFAKIVSPKEWSGALQLLIISGIVLPILPDTAVDPWGAIVPYDIWLVVIFISAIGFVGYFLNKFLGTKSGTMVTSLVGALVSSTVVTTHLAAQGKKGNGRNDLLILGVIIAIATMLLRVTFVMAVLTPSEYLLSVIVVPLVMLVVVSLLGLYWYGRSQDELLHEQKKIPKNPELRSPFEIIPALQFAALFIVVMLAVQIGQIYFGKYGVIATTFFSAFADVDAAIVSVLQTLRSSMIDPSLVTLVITIAVIVNTMVKALYVWIISRNRQLSLHVLVVTLLASILGVVAFLLM